MYRAVDQATSDDEVVPTVQIDPNSLNRVREIWEIHVTYRMSQSLNIMTLEARLLRGSLVDRGANGGMAGATD